MATKEQERKALEQIRKIVEGLGEDSYIGTAMAGMFQDAEENIENDFAMSWKDRAETYERKLEELSKIHDRDTYETGKKLDIAQKELQLAKETMKQEAERANGAWQRVEELKQKIEALKIANNALCEREDAYKARIEAMDMEIIKLKARLFDMIEK